MAAAVTAYALNIADMFCTLYVGSLGVQECNPLMGNTAIMVVYKVIVCGALLAWLGTRTERVARMGLRLCALIYAIVLAYHIAGIFHILA